MGGGVYGADVMNEINTERYVVAIMKLKKQPNDKQKSRSCYANSKLILMNPQYVAKNVKYTQPTQVEIFKSRSGLVPLFR